MKRLLMLFMLCAAVIYAQPPQPLLTVSPMVAGYTAALKATYNLIAPYAQFIFWSLVTIEMSFFFVTAIFQHQDLTSLGGAFVFQIVGVIVANALMVNAGSWMPQIVDSFGLIGFRASGFTNPLSPTDIFSVGTGLSTVLFKAASDAGWFSDTAMCLVMIIAGIGVFVSFALIAIQLVHAQFQGYVAVAMGAILLAFGGSRWTRPYSARYLGLVIASGVRLMCIEILIGIGIVSTVNWATNAKGIAVLPSPVMGALDILGGSLLFMSICWHIPKYIATVIGGAPSFSGMEAVHTAGSAIRTSLAGMYVAQRISGAVGGMSSGGSAASAAASSPSNGNGNSRKAVTGYKP